MSTAEPSTAVPPDNLRRRVQMHYAWDVQRVEIPMPGQPAGGQFGAPSGMRLAHVVPLGREQPKVMGPGAKVATLVMMIYEGAAEVTERAPPESPTVVK